MSFPAVYDNCDPIPLLAITDPFEDLKLAICGCVTDSTNAMTRKVDEIAADTRQVLLNLGDEVNENQAIIESQSGNTRMFL